MYSYESSEFLLEMLVPRYIGLSLGTVRITSAWSENRVTVVKPAWFIHEYHFFLKNQMKSYLRMETSKKSLTQRFDVAMTSLSSDKIKNKNLIYRMSQCFVPPIS